MREEGIGCFAQIGDDLIIFIQDVAYFEDMVQDVIEIIIQFFADEGAFALGQVGLLPAEDVAALISELADLYRPSEIEISEIRQVPSLNSIIPDPPSGNT